MVNAFLYEVQGTRFYVGRRDENVGHAASSQIHGGFGESGRLPLNFNLSLRLVPGQSGIINNVEFHVNVQTIIHANNTHAHCLSSPTHVVSFSQ